MEFSDGEIRIKVLDSVEAIRQEGEAMHHCVFTNEYYLKADSLILSATIDGKRIETIEVSLKRMEVVQRTAEVPAGRRHRRPPADSLRHCKILPAGGADRQDAGGGDQSEAPENDGAAQLRHAPVRRTGREAEPGDAGRRHSGGQPPGVMGVTFCCWSRRTVGK